MALEHWAIDRLLAEAVTGSAVGWPVLAGAAGSNTAVIERIAYHGLAGLLIDKVDDFDGSAPTSLATLRSATLADAMWELRHRQLLNQLLAGLAAERIVAVLLKGTALAYDLYSAPAARTRGDTDLLVAPRDLARTRLVLEALGFELHGGNVGVPDTVALQEVWSRSCDGSIEHHVDLHWHLLNAPALRHLLPFDECVAGRVALSRLGPDAYAMDRTHTLLHACAHRAMHFRSPYFVDRTAYYGGDRLIWLFDIHLLAVALSDDQWSRFTDLADANGLSSLCLDGLRLARAFFATTIPPTVEQNLAAVGAKSGVAYFRNHQLRRAWADFRSIAGVRGKLDYVIARALPSAAFIRDKYPAHAALPLPLLYTRRLVDLVRPRPHSRDM